MGADSKVIHWLGAEVRILRKQVSALVGVQEHGNGHFFDDARLCATSVVELQDLPVAGSEVRMPFKIALHEIVFNSVECRTPFKIDDEVHVKSESAGQEAFEWNLDAAPYTPQVVCSRSDLREDELSRDWMLPLRESEVARALDCLGHVVDDYLCEVAVANAFVSKEPELDGKCSTAKSEVSNTSTRTAQAKSSWPTPVTQVRSTATRMARRKSSRHTQGTQARRSATPTARAESSRPTLATQACGTSTRTAQVNSSWPTPVTQACSTATLTAQAESLRPTPVTQACGTSTWTAQGKDSLPTPVTQACSAATRTTQVSSADGEEEYDNDHMESFLSGLYWRHLAPEDIRATEQLEDIGDLAIVGLHGAVVQRVLQAKWGIELPSVHRAKFASTAACRMICKVWKKHNLSRLLRHETYHELIQILTDMLEELLHDA